jgi:hypothetical protein
MSDHRPQSVVEVAAEAAQLEDVVGDGLLLPAVRDRVEQ